MFEPIHGSAPDIAGQGIANPIGTIWSGALLLEHLGEKQAADLIVRAIEKTVRDGVLTVDLGGTANTVDVANRVMQNVGEL
jgi:tartrate dehydrogenase/decarboxylase/D-malate dehydrogenase